MKQRATGAERLLTTYTSRTWRRHQVVRMSCDWNVYSLCHSNSSAFTRFATGQDSRDRRYGDSSDGANSPSIVVFRRTPSVGSNRKSTNGCSREPRLVDFEAALV